RQILVALYMDITLGDPGSRHRDDLLVAAAVILHPEHADRTRIHDRPRNDGPRGGDQHIDRIAVVGQGVRQAAVVPGTAHGRIEETVHDARSGCLVHLVFDGFAADR